MAQVVGALLPTWKTCTQLQDPSMGLVQPHQLGALEE